MKIKRFVCNAFQENAYVVSRGASCIIIDPGFAGDGNGAAGELDGLYEYLEAEGIRPEAILLTHTHWDHTLGVAPLVEKFGIPVISNPPDGSTALGFKVISTPGHTPDSVCYYDAAEHVLFTGDTLFAGTIGRTDLPGGNYDDEIRSIMEKLIFLPGETDIYPGHGPASTIARERTENPFLEPFNEPEETEFEA